MTSRSSDEDDRIGEPGWLVVKSAWIPRKLPSLNRLLAIRKQGHRSRITKEWHNEVEPCPYHKRPKPDGPRRQLTITRIIGKGGRAYDEDNLAGGAKPLLAPKAQVRGACWTSTSRYPRRSLRRGTPLRSPRAAGQARRAPHRRARRRRERRWSPRPEATGERHAQGRPRAARAERRGPAER